MRAKSEAETNVMVESCEKRMKMLEYDLIAKQEEVNRMEQVKTEAYHKMTLMKAEYTGRVKRRDDKVSVCVCVCICICICMYIHTCIHTYIHTYIQIAELEAKIDASNRRKEATVPADSNDKENEISQNETPKVGDKATKVEKASKKEKKAAETEGSRRSTRRDAKALAPRC